MRIGQWRTVTIGAALLASFAESSRARVVRGGAKPDPREAPGLELLRRTFELADQARQGGSAPYGALVAAADGSVVVERGNESALADGDPTRHAEMVCTADAWRVLGCDGMSRATLYASTEPCVMCAGAAYCTGIGRVVYGMSSTRLLAFTGDDPAHASFAMPCRDILEHGARPVTVVGPLLEDEAARSHEGYWH
jgi:tRNA(Arg) A34 adenosine deaminase TadA